MTATNKAPRTCSRHGMSSMRCSAPPRRRWSRCCSSRPRSWRTCSRPKPEADGTRTFMSPVVFHYTNILFLSLIALVPDANAGDIFASSSASPRSAAWLYSIFVAVRVFRHSISDLPDRLATACAPVARLFAGPGRGVARIPPIRGRPQRAGRRGAVAARGQHPQRLGPDAVAGAPERPATPKGRIG